MSWYYVDKDGNTQGPKQLTDMQQCFLQGKLAPQSFVWNGADVNQWTPLNKVSKLLKSCQDYKKSKQQPKKPMGGGPPNKRPRKSPFGGGGRSALLGAIQRGAKLRKAPKPQETKVGQPAPKKPGQKLSLREQMALTLRRRKMGGGGNKVNNKPKPKPQQKTTKPWNSNNNTKKTQSKPWNSNNNNKTTTTKSWGNKNKTTTSSSGNSRIDNITKKLKNAQDWQLKAIEKLLS